MRVYVGQTRSAHLIRRLAALGFGECTLRGELPPRRRPWMYDSGAYSDFTQGRAFDYVRFERDITAIWSRDMARPDFIVAPDLVGRGLESLRHSLAHVTGPLAPYRGYPAPIYLAVQDGMDAACVEATASLWGGLFVGGTMKWKLETAPRWVALAHRLSMKCHIGRCGAVDRVRWARRLGADSIDSCVPLWSDANLCRFRAALDSPQLELDAEEPLGIEPDGDPGPIAESGHRHEAHSEILPLEEPSPALVATKRRAIRW
jgi:hypothetical protein